MRLDESAACIVHVCGGHVCHVALYERVPRLLRQVQVQETHLLQRVVQLTKPREYSAARRARFATEEDDGERRRVGVGRRCVGVERCAQLRAAEDLAQRARRRATLPLIGDRAGERRRALQVEDRWGHTGASEGW